MLYLLLMWILYFINCLTCKAKTVARQKLNPWLMPDGTFVFLGSIADHATENENPSDMI